MNQRLKGRRIAALAADGFEKVELVQGCLVLRRGNGRTTAMGT